jgi:hypothetical protein
VLTETGTPQEEAAEEEAAEEETAEEETAGAELLHVEMGGATMVDEEAPQVGLAEVELSDAITEELATGVDVSVTGQTVVETAMMEVTTSGVSVAGQFVTPGAQLMMVLY